MANKVLIVAKREYLERVRSRTFVVMTLLVPVLLAASFLLPTYMAGRSNASLSTRHIRIIDATGAGVGARIALEMRADSTVPDSVRGPFVVNVTAAELPAAEKDAAAEVMKPHSLIGYLVVDDSTLSGQLSSTVSTTSHVHRSSRQSTRAAASSANSRFPGRSPPSRRPP